jgi:hypothetical protein
MWRVGVTLLAKVDYEGLGETAASGVDKPLRPQPSCGNPSQSSFPNPEIPSLQSLFAAEKIHENR